MRQVYIAHRGITATVSEHAATSIPPIHLGLHMTGAQLHAFLTVEEARTLAAELQDIAMRAELTLSERAAA